MSIGRKKTVLIAIFLIFAIVVLGPPVNAANIYVPDNYAKIQWAVDNATAGDTIIVREGTYTENVDVNKRLTIRSENGPENCIVQAANPDDHVFEVRGDYVNISGFTIRNASRPYGAGWKPVGYFAGICLKSVDHCSISDSTASNNGYGIYLSSSDNNTITNNVVSNNNRYGILLFPSSNNNIIMNNTGRIRLASSSNNNIIRDNNASDSWDGIYLRCSSNNMLVDNTANSSSNGIYLYSSNNNTLTSNNASNNGIDGITLFSSSNNTLTNNTMSGNTCNFHVEGVRLSKSIHNIDWSNKVDGKPVYYWVNQKNKQVPTDAGFVGIVNSTNITVRDLTLTNNSQGVLFAYTKNSRIENITASNNWDGIYLSFSNNNILRDNTANLNNNGIHLDSSSNNTLTNNTASNNRYLGIDLGGQSGNNLIYLNSFINNHLENFALSRLPNIWNSTSKITYIYNENTYTNYLGNQWSDYIGLDANNDGIGDTPYSPVIKAIDIIDYYPLMPYFENSSILPQVIQTVKPTTTPPETSPPTEKTPVEEPGFEAIFAIAGLLAVAYLLKRRK